MDPLSITSTPPARTQQTSAPAPAPTTTKADKPPVEGPNLGQRVEAEKKATTASESEARNDVPERHSSSLKFIVDGNRVITTIVDDQSKQVVVQIPDAELIRIAKSIDRMQGFFIEQKA